MTHPIQPSLEEWENKLNELGFIHPPLHRMIKNLISQAKAQERKRIKSELNRLKPDMVYEPGGKLAAYESGYESAIEEVTDLLTPQKEEKV